jgi:putative endonuclease
MKATAHYVYVLRCADDTFYCGYTTDIERRVDEHNGEGRVAGAKYTNGRRPVQVVHTESFKTRSEALKREAQIKKMSKLQKSKLIQFVT